MAAQQTETKSRTIHRPCVDIAESEKRIELWLEMPGLDENSTEISFEKNTLTIKGNLTESCSAEPDSGLFEYETVDFERKFEIAADVDVDEIQATMKDGLLHLLVPKKIESARKIAIEKRD